MNSMEIKFSASLANEAFARTAVISFIAPLNPSLEEISEIKTLVSEAVSNAIIHGYRLDASKEITIKCTIDKNIVSLVISDFGVGIENLQQALTPHFTTRPDLERAGMGITIMQSLSDDFSIRSVLGMGTKVMIKKQLCALPNINYGVTNS